MRVNYKIQTTHIFDDWFSSIKSISYRARITKRLDLVELGHFGDHKFISGSLSELRFFFGSGYRIYYTVKGIEVILLLSGGDKSTQSKDIKRAKAIMEALE